MHHLASWGQTVPLPRRVLSLDFAGVIAPKDFIDYLWYYVIPRRLSRVERISLYEAMLKVDRAYSSIPSERLEWYIPAFWLKVLNLEASVEDLYIEALEVAEPYGDALDVIPRLAQRFNIVVVTNTPKRLVEMFLERYPQIGRNILRVFSCIDDFAIPKKRAEFYSKILKALGIEAKHLIHVGDDPVHDVEEPTKIGIRAFLLDRRAKIGSRSVLKTLYDLEDKLETIELC